MYELKLRHNGVDTVSDICREGVGLFDFAYDGALFYFGPQSHSLTLDINLCGIFAFNGVKQFKRKSEIMSCCGAVGLLQ